MKKHLGKIFAVGLLSIIILNACTGQPAPLAAPTGRIEPAMNTPTDEAASPWNTNEALPTPALATPTPLTQVTAADTTPAPTLIVPTKQARTQLEATDPTTVSLSAGKPQLVEFFAFW